MLVTNSIHFVDSNVDSHFTGSLPVTDGASLYADIQFAEGNPAAAGPYSKALLQSARILSIQNRRWRLDFYDRTVPLATPTISTNGLLGSIEMVLPGGAQPSAYHATAFTVGTLFCYIAENFSIPYHDKTAQGQLHVNLVAMDVGAVKLANSAGALHLRVGTIFAS